VCTSQVRLWSTGRQWQDKRADYSGWLHGLIVLSRLVVTWCRRTCTPLLLELTSLSWWREASRWSNGSTVGQRSMPRVGLHLPRHFSRQSPESCSAKSGCSCLWCRKSKVVEVFLLICPIPFRANCPWNSRYTRRRITCIFRVMGNRRPEKLIIMIFAILLLSSVVVNSVKLELTSFV